MTDPIPRRDIYADVRPHQLNSVPALTKEQLETAKTTQASIAQLVDLTNENVKLARKATWFSVIVASVSTTVAIGSLVVAIVTLNAH